MYKLFLCLRYLRRRRIAFFAVAAVCLCVAMVLIVVSVMDGFLQMVKDRSRGMLGDLVMESVSLTGFPYYQEFIDEVKAEVPEVLEATPVVISYGVLRFPSTEQTEMVQLVGLRLDETCRVNNFEQGLFYEKYYPGTTTLADQGMPCAGRLDFALPEKYEKAYQKWLASADEDEQAEVPIDSRISYNRPGYFGPVPYEYAEQQGSWGPAIVGPELPGAILGLDLCAYRKADGQYDRRYLKGEEITLTFVPFGQSGKLTDLTDAFSRPYRYADDVRTGVYDVDSISVYLDFDDLQAKVRLGGPGNNLPKESGGLPLPPRATQVQFKLKPGSDPVAIRKLLNERWEEFAYDQLDEWSRKVRAAVMAYERIAATQPAEEHEDFWESEFSPEERIIRATLSQQHALEMVQIQTWQERQARYIAAVEKEKILVTILFGVISLVAVFMVGTIFYMIVQQKTRDIGIVKSVGATSFGVGQIFLMYGAAVGVVGGAMGTALGTVFVWYINDIQDLLTKINPALQVWSPEVYTFDYIPNTVSVFNAVVIYGVAIVASVIGSLIAAWRASRVWPVEALRYE